MTDRPNIDDYRNRAERAEAECKELREILTGEVLSELRLVAEMTSKTPAQIMAHWLSRVEQGPQPSEREKAALAILRVKAIEQAVSIAKPGESEWETSRRADALLAHILGS